jgi:hypothetical protein
LWLFTPTTGGLRFLDRTLPTSEPG